MPPLPASELPPLPLLLALAVTLTVSALTNCALLAAIYRRNANGLEILLIQISITDILQALTTSIGIWTHNSDWPFGTKNCTTFKGLDILMTTASIYLTAVVALHSITMANDEKRAFKQMNRRNDLEFQDEDKSSQHSLMANSDFSTPPRTMNNNFSQAANNSVLLPTVLVWILAASLSVPGFTLSTTVRTSHGMKMCSIIDAAYQINIDTIIVTVFNLLLPTLMFAVISVMLIRTLRSLNVYVSDKDVFAGLKIALFLCAVYFVMSFPRLVVVVVSGYFSSEQDLNLAPVAVVSSGLYLAATIFRPLLIIYVNPNLREVFHIK